MKLKESLLVAACFVAVLAASCTNETEVRDSFALSRYSVAFASGGGETAVAVAASGEWSAATDAAWLSLNCSGSTLTVTAMENVETTDIRTADIIVTSSEGEALTLEAVQEPATAVKLEVSVGTADHVIDSEGGTFTVSVTCNYDWTASLEPEVEGWTLDAGHEGIVTVSAEANAGEAKTSKLVISAGSGELAAEQSVEITQISRTENGYYQCVGAWDIYADDWYYGAEDLNDGGTYDSCTIAEFDYTTSLLSVIGLGLSSVQTDRLQFNKKDNTLVWPIGYLCGTTRASNGYTYYLYIVALTMDGHFITADLDCTLSEDGETITIDSMPEDYPFLGIVGYNGYLGYVLWTNVYYPTGSIQLRKSSASASSLSVGAGSSIDVEPVTGPLPDGVPARLTSGSFSIIK